MCCGGWGGGCNSKLHDTGNDGDRGQMYQGRSQYLKLITPPSTRAGSVVSVEIKETRQKDK